MTLDWSSFIAGVVITVAIIVTVIFLESHWMICERCGHEHPSEVGRTLKDALLRCIANLRADLAATRKGFHESCFAERDRLRADLAVAERRVLRWQHAAHGGCSADADGKLLCELATPGDFARAVNHYQGVVADLEAERAEHTRATLAVVIERKRTWDAEERAAQAEAQCAAMREAAAQAAETQPFYPDTHTGMRQQWVKVQIAAKIRALPPDAGRDLLTAVRRLIRLGTHIIDAIDRGAFTSVKMDAGLRFTDTYKDLRDTLADPALTAIKGA